MTGGKTVCFASPVQPACVELAPVAVAAGRTTLGITSLAVAAIAETTAAAFTTGGTILARLGFVHANRTTMQILVIQTRDRSLGLLSVRHFHEAEAAGLTRKLINNYAGRRNRTIRFKGLTKVTIGGPVRKIPNEYIHTIPTLLITVANIQSRYGSDQTGSDF